MDEARRPPHPRVRSGRFIPDHTDKAWVGRYHGRLKITWSGELVERLDALDAQIVWLSTWQPYIDTLNPKFGVTWPTLHWYDPVTREGRYTGKRRMVLDHVKLNRPIVWIDDEETTYQAGLAITSNEPTAPVLAVGPDSHIGISRPQMSLIEQFVAAPPNEPAIRFEIAGNDHEEHWGF